ncbi:DUF72 domain-containing protein [Thioalkalivibrio sulfidiphilus]|uniref:DUF72 domain-containing protein n=1 Tax=Thioalkalivibrio sulfidiphilus TaxID=1033854 RepID=UPI000374E561|nr:DUF72 domain-containing protein [Thioalkalivibrio sulfidiphilus]
MAVPQGRLRIGTSGYQYQHWAGCFYPAELPRRDWFAHYAGFFDTVEINNTFYRLPGADTFEHWRVQAPAGFVYALKFSRYGSHLKHLKDPDRTIGRFLAAAEHLGEHLGPILVQLPPRWRADVPRLDAFLACAPRQHRWAVEFRDPDWLRDEVFEVMKRHGAALCIHDLIPGHPEVLTTDWTYLRFHGGPDGGAYRNAILSARARQVRSLLMAGKDVYAYFNNDIAGHAVRNALTLKRDLADLRAGEPQG